MLNRARKARPRQRPELPSPAAAAPKTDPDLRARLAALPERQRHVVFLRYFADLGYREIAEILGIEVGTVSATLHAAHAALREELQEVIA